MTDTTEDRWLLPKQVAPMIPCDLTTVYRRWRKWGLKHQPIGGVTRRRVQFSEKSVLEFIEREVRK